MIWRKSRVGPKSDGPAQYSTGTTSFEPGLGEVRVPPGPPTGIASHGLPKEGRWRVARHNTGLLHREAQGHHVPIRHATLLHWHHIVQDREPRPRPLAPTKPVRQSPKPCERVEARDGTKYSDRIRLLSLNVGSLSTLLWQELKEYLLKAPYDVICLQETHWSTSSEFVVQGWRAIHSGTKARADGVLTLLHPRHRADTIRHEEIQPGRILRTQLQTPQGRVELFNCYQFPHNFTVNPTVLRDKRQALLSKLGRAIAGIPLRATLVVVGDFQAEVKPAVPHVGRSTCNTPFHTGADALQMLLTLF